jgi:hypothetical protein
MSPIKLPKLPAKRGRPKLNPPNPPNPSGTKQGDDNTLEDDAKQDLEDEQQTPFTEMEIEADWRKPNTKRPAQDCWLFPSLLSKYKKTTFHVQQLPMQLHTNGRF